MAVSFTNVDKVVERDSSAQNTSTPELTELNAKKNGLSDNELASKSSANNSNDELSTTLSTSAAKPQYDGDYKDDSGPLSESGYEALDIDNPSILLGLIEEEVKNGTVTLHKWQADTLEELATAKPNQLHPYKLCLCAANGSGKDKFVIAIFAVWFALCKIRSRCIITSSSGVQLTAQTETYIRDYCEKVNIYLGYKVFHIRQRYIKCLKSGSEIRMFATDEKGKAEGYHPIDAHSEMAIIVNEGKTVTDDIHQALRRCTGFNYWLEISSPGSSKGFFYKAFTNWKHVRRITSFDCPNISPPERDEDRLEYGEHSAFYRSKHLALFTNDELTSIIPNHLIEALLIKDIPAIKTVTGIRIGIDLAAGGDENALCFVLGNKVLKEYWFRETDTTITASRIDQILRDEKILKSHDFIFADDGGVGRSIIDQLVKMGWNINRVMNQWAPLGNKKMYGNRGAENWYRVKRFFEEGLFDPKGLSPKTIEQLTSRQYHQVGTGSRMFLEKKKEAIAHGRPSPDRADAFVLSLSGISIDDFLKDEKKDSTAPVDNRTGQIIKTKEEMEEYLEQYRYHGMQTDASYQSKRCFGSLKKALN